MTLFEPTTPGVSLCVAYQLKGKRVLVIGGGIVAAGRILALLNASAIITLITPLEGCCEEVLFRLQIEKVIPIYHNRKFKGQQDLDEFDYEMVFTAIDEAGLSATIHSMAKLKRIIVNVADVPPLCDIYFGSMITKGPLQIMFSTGGKGPRIAARLRRDIEEKLSTNVAEAIESVGKLRNELRQQVDGKDVTSIANRMEWMIKVCDQWSLNDLATMSPEERQSVLQGYELGEARSKWEVKGWGIVGKALGRMGVGRCPARASPDGRKARCPFIVGMSGFVLGAGTVGLGLLVLKKVWRS